MSKADTLSGIALAGFAAVYFYQSVATMKLGTPLSMGPGYFPMVVSGMVIVIGVAIALTGAVRSAGADEVARYPVPWRALAAIGAAPITFAILLQPAGALIALTATTFVATRAVRGAPVVPALLGSVAMAVFCYLVFVRLLQLNLPAFGRLGALLGV